MMPRYLHDHPSFIDLLYIVAEEKGVEPGLVEKDYWIMHVLYGLKEQGFEFELKGGTSLSKGYQIIERFSEDIYIHMKPPAWFEINENPKNCNPRNVESRKRYYDWLASHIRIDGIVSVERDTLFDETECYRSGGIRLHYDARTNSIDGVKEGVLLEAGFDITSPNSPILISSWAIEKALSQQVMIIDNRAKEILCYHPGFTLVEKLQTIATKYRHEIVEGGTAKVNFMRQYYDVYCLLSNETVLAFIGSEPYNEHKRSRFPEADLDIPVSQNEAFLLTSEEQRAVFKARYHATAALYYNGQPPFNDLLERIREHIHLL